MLHKYIRYPWGFVLWPAWGRIHFLVNEALATPAAPPISAGFAALVGDKFICQGDSATLALSSLPEDSILLTEQFRLGDY